MNTRPPRERETKLMRSVIVRLRRLGIVLFRRNVATFRAEHRGKTRLIRCGARGQSDLYGYVIGTARHVEIETKARGNRPTEYQLAWLRDCTRHGAIAYWGDDCSIIERVMEAVLAGGRIAWREDGTYDVEVPP